MQKSVEQAVAFVVGAVSQYKLFLRDEILGHFLQPVRGSGGAFNIREEQVLVCGTANAHGKGELVSAYGGDCTVEIHQLDVAVLALVFLHEELGEIV